MQERKESWKTINELLNKRSKSSSIDCLKVSDSETVCKKEISNKMNTLFCSVGKDLADKIDPVSNPLILGHYKVNPFKAEFRFRTIEVKEIRDAFVKTAKSFGTDNISSYFLKLALPFIENSLAFLFNTSIETSQFPTKRIAENSLHGYCGTPPSILLPCLGMCRFN